MRDGIVIMRIHCLQRKMLLKLSDAGRSALAGVLLLLSAAPGISQSVQEVTLRLDFLPGGYHAPFFVALERGYYKESGIDLRILDGKGSGPTVQVVGSNLDTFGLAGMSTVATAISKGIPLVSVGGLIQQDPNSILSLANSGITKPKDVEGKRGALVSTSASDRLFQALVKAANIDMSKVAALNVSNETRYSVVLRGAADFTVGWSFTDGYRLNKQQKISPPILFSDYGVTMLGVGIFVTKETAAKRPELVKAFLAATAKGAQDAIDDPRAAVAAITKARPDADPDFLLDGVNNLAKFIHTKSSANLPLLVMSKSDWEETRRNLIDFLDLPPTLNAEAFYTNDFFSNR
jgi:NitT/TauT family transport system substrate-binding protein